MSGAVEEVVAVVLSVATAALFLRGDLPSHAGPPLSFTGLAPFENYQEIKRLIEISRNERRYFRPPTVSPNMGSRIVSVVRHRREEINLRNMFVGISFSTRISWE